ncbi:MAG: hypothetical protein HN929_02025 [Chloroflexi bacterium]|jgi:hypothetical protein|nr:hypothetical protein [Chloroflexota bacterium]
MANEDGAAAVQALGQAAQGAAQGASQGVANQIMQAGQGTGQAAAPIGGMAGYPGDFGITPFRPDYADPNEWSPLGDAMILSHKARLQDQNVPGMFQDPGRYMDMGIAQRNAAMYGSRDSITGIMESGDPLLDIMTFFDMQDFDPYHVGGGAPGAGSGVGGDAGVGGGGDGDGGV